jgi:DNA adenine methylase
MIKTKIQRKYLYTPLRYPGGKTSLFRFFEEIIGHNQWKDVVYIEPYAGGAGAALSLLITNSVSSIVINDYDSAIYSFWISILNETESFVEMINNIATTPEEWRKQKEIYRAADVNKPLELGFATFFLNRTNRSGILNAGPIGGQTQNGEWKMDARFNRQALIDKIKLIATYKNRIKVSNIDGLQLIEEYASNQSSFFYIDPPYFVKGAKLYLNAFKSEDHENLAHVLNKYKDVKWVLTYDSVPEIRQLYKNRNYAPFDLSYSAHHDTKSGSEIMVFSDALDEAILYH